MSLKPSNVGVRPTTIRRLRLDEADEAVDLFVVQLREHRLSADRKVILKTLRQIASDTRLGFILVAVGPGRKIIGVALGTAFLGLEHGGPSGWIEEIFVLPEYRNQGVGSALIRKFIQTAARLRWRAIDLEVDSTHGRVVPLYRRHGFHLLSRRRFTRNIKD